MPPFDFVKIKSEGLQVDFLKYSQEGYEAIKPEDYYRLKTYGYCMQKHEGYFMIRIRIPGGVIRADQMERIASLAERLGHGSVHLTTRGNVELHSVRINDFFTLRDELAEVDITTRSSCGHTFRNILGCHQNGVCPKQSFDLYPWIQKIHQHIFERADHYNPRMPNRMNVSFSGCSNCSADARINDIAFVAKEIREGERTLYGFELWTAGSLGKTPKMGYKLKEFISFEEVIPALEAITELHCQFGDHKNALVKGRLKFLVAQWGFEKFRDEFEKQFVEFKTKQAPLPPELAQPEIFPSVESNGAVPLGEGIYPQRQKGFYRVQFWVPLGEVSASQYHEIAELSKQFADSKAYHTTRQNFEFHWLKEENIPLLLEAMKKVGFAPTHSESVLNVVACPGTSFCALAVTSSQGAAQVLMKEFRHRGLAEDSDLRNLSINISGCPNSCAKHQIADIGFSGGMTELDGIRRFGYQLYVGGKFSDGEVREGTMIKKGIADDLVFPLAESLMEFFKEKKSANENFPTFVDRIGPQNLAAFLEEELLKKKPEPPGSPILMNPRQVVTSKKDSGIFRIGMTEDWEKGSPSKIVSALGDEIAVFKTLEGFKACQNICPHAGGSLGKGANDGKTVTCPLHGWQFDLEKGNCLTEPGNDIKIYQIEVKEGEVFLKP